MSKRRTALDKAIERIDDQMAVLRLARELLDAERSAGVRPPKPRKPVAPESKG